ncbi:hypothetical protein KY362_03105, partial [Candidatus Woesearchaeota archaeon]|nr:hypothetical protein [Candidatus Woesearchaeota archaeon]
FAHPIDRVVDAYRAQKEALETILNSLGSIKMMKPEGIFWHACEAVMDPIFTEYIVPLSEDHPAILAAALIGLEKTAARAQIAQRYQEFKDPEVLKKELEEEADNLDADDILLGFDADFERDWLSSMGDTAEVLNGDRQIGDDMEYPEEPWLSDLETWLYGTGQERTALMQRIEKGDDIQIYSAVLVFGTKTADGEKPKRGLQVKHFKGDAPEQALEDDKAYAETETPGNWSTFVWDFGVMDNHFGWPASAMISYAEALGNIDMYNFLQRVMDGNFSYEQHLPKFMATAAELAYRTLDEYIVGPFISSHRILETSEELWYNSLAELGPLGRTTPNIKEVIDHPLEYLARLEDEKGDVDLSTEGQRIEIEDY